MRRFFVCALPLLLCAISSSQELTPRVGVVEIYGTRKVSANKVRSALDVQEGGPLPPSRGDLEDKLDRISGVVASRVEAVCCTDGKTILYVGIEEKDSPHFEYRPEPDGDITLPSEITEAYSDFIDAVNQSIRLGQTGESFSLGYSIMQNAGARSKQQAFIPLAAKYLETIHRVVRTSYDADQRGMAAYVLQYAPRSPRTTTQIVNDLQYALQDVDDTVRANAIRALRAMYVGSKLHPEQQVTIQPTWMVELLNSVAWGDRHNASLALVDMTENHNEETLQLIRERALPSVLEMARWHDLGHALPAFILAGRLAGLTEPQIQQAWIGPDHEAVLKQAAKKRQS